MWTMLSEGAAGFRPRNEQGPRVAITPLSAADKPKPADQKPDKAPEPQKPDGPAAEV